MQANETQILTDFTSFMRTAGIKKLTIELDSLCSVEKPQTPPEQKKIESSVEQKSSIVPKLEESKEKKEKVVVEQKSTVQKVQCENKKPIEKTEESLQSIAPKKSVNLLNLFFNAFDLMETKVELDGEQVTTSSLIDRMSLDELKHVINQLELGIDIDQPVAKLRELVSAPIVAYFGE